MECFVHVATTDVEVIDAEDVGISRYGSANFLCLPLIQNRF